MIRKELKTVIFSLQILLIISVSAMAQKTVGLAIKFTPEAPDSFETALLTLTDDEFSINVKNIDGNVVFSERFNFTNMDIETIEDLVQEVTNNLPDVFEITFVKDTPIYVLNPNQGSIKRSPFVPFNFFNNRIYDKAHRMPGSLSFGSVFYDNDGFGDTGHFTFAYNVNYEYFQLGRRVSLYLLTGMQFTSDEPDTVSGGRALTIPKDLHFSLGPNIEIKFSRIHIAPVGYFDWSVKNFTIITNEIVLDTVKIRDAFYRLQYGARLSLPISVVGVKGSFVLEYLISSFEIPSGIVILDPNAGNTPLTSVDGTVIRGKFPILGSRITLGIEYIDLDSDKGLDDSLTINALANFSINDVAAILRRAFKI